MAEPSAWIEHTDFLGTSVVCVHLMGVVLVMSPTAYDQNIARGKAFRRWQANEARAAKRAADDEARQIKMDWIREDG